MKTLFCSNCGTRLNEGARFCHGCGAAVSPAPEPVPQPAPIPQPVPAPVFQPEPMPQPVPAPVPQPEPMPQPVPAPVPQPEPMPQPAPEPVPAPKPVQPPKQKKTWTRPANSPRTAGAVVLCVLIFLCSFLSIVLLNVQSLTSQDILEQSLEEMVLNLDLTRIQASDVLSNAEPGTSVAELIAQEIEKSYVVEVDVDEDDVQEFLEESSFLPFIAEKISEYADDIRNDRRGTGITERELENLLWENEDEIEDLVGMPLTQTDVDNVVAKADTQGLMKSLRAKTLKNDIPVAYSALQIALSEITVIVLVVLMILMALLVAKIYKWNIFQACGSVGTVLTVSGGIFVALTLIALVMNLVWSSIISYALQTVLVKGLMASGITCAIGVVLLVVDLVSKKSLKTA